MNTEHNLTGLISAAVAEKMTPDFVEKEVNTRVEKLIVESIDRALRSYSDTGKLIEKAVEEALKVERLDLPSYGAIVTDMLKAQINARVSELVAGRLAADMDELLGLAPKEVKLSEIAEYMLEEFKEGDHWGDCITVIVEETRYGSTWVFLDAEKHHEDRDKYRCKFRMQVSEGGEIHGAYVGDSDFARDNHGKRDKWIGRAHGLEQRLRAYVACGTKIILDTDAVCIGVGDY
jgi:hypothetical protein